MGLNNRSLSHLESFDKTAAKEELQEGEEVMDFQNWKIQTIWGEEDEL